MTSFNENNLIWIDLEMTGLNPEEDRILEIASIVTDSNLNILAEGPVFAIHQAQTQLDQMNSWCTKQHGKSGLTQRVQESNISESKAEKETLEFLKICAWKPHPFVATLYTKIVVFIEIYADTWKLFHYRQLDVSTLKILAQKWAPSIAEDFKKESSHLALQDIRDSIEELRYYRKYFLK